MFKPTDKPKRYLAAAAFAAVLITVPCLGALNTSADQARMEWPAPEHFEISSVYGSRYDHSDFHMGIDISDAEIANSDVVAAADGKVVDVTSEKSEQGYGVSIIIAHENGLFTRYAHLASESVSKGDTVAKGQTIGTMGDTGAADFPQLHFEVIRDGKTVDPMQYFEK